MDHHAYLIVGERDRGVQHARRIFALPSDIAGDPDIQILAYESFGIDDVRQLQRWAYQKPVASGRRYFIVTCETLTHETQNALLKLFEEPPATSVFALIISNEERILPTLRSRFALVRAAAHEIDATVVRAFLSLSHAERIAEIGRRTKDKELVWVQTLLSALELHMYKTQNTAVLHSLLFVRRYIERRGASSKMLLEHLALSLPHE